MTAVYVHSFTQSLFQRLLRNRYSCHMGDSPIFGTQNTDSHQCLNFQDLFTPKPLQHPNKALWKHIKWLHTTLMGRLFIGINVIIAHLVIQLNTPHLIWWYKLSCCALVGYSVNIHVTYMTCNLLAWWMPRRKLMRYRTKVKTVIIFSEFLEEMMKRKWPWVSYDTES